MADRRLSCVVQGCGPAETVTRRLWSAPWRTRDVAVCWVCGRPLTPAEVVTAEALWRPAFDWWRARTGRAVGQPSGGDR